MNTLQTQAVLPSKNTSNMADASAVVSKKPIAQAKEVVTSSDSYSASSANDAVIAKVLSFSINKSVESSIAGEKATQANTLSEKFKQAQQEIKPSFDIESVTKNVVGFVSKAISNLALQGHGADKLEYFKNQAITGVEVGIDQAKLELVGIVDNTMFDIIDDTRDLIVGGIKNLPSNKEDYINSAHNSQAISNGTDTSFNRIGVSAFNEHKLNINFETNLFKESQELSQENKLYTTSASNISFSIEGKLGATDTKLVADLVNKVDSLANSFYRANIEAAYNKSLDLGYSNQELLGLSAELQKTENRSTTQTYGQIQHLDKATDMKELTAPKAVAEYLNRYLDVLDSSKSTLTDEQDFKQIINGLVNQMNDVQVPDLLQAINRFHTFNSKFF